MNGMQLKTVFIFSSLKLNCNSKKANIYPIFWSVCSSMLKSAYLIKTWKSILNNILPDYLAIEQKCLLPYFLPDRENLK